MKRIISLVKYLGRCLWFTTVRVVLLYYCKRAAALRSRQSQLPCTHSTLESQNDRQNLKYSFSRILYRSILRAAVPRPTSHLPPPLSPLLPLPPPPSPFPKQNTPSCVAAVAPLLLLVWTAEAALDSGALELVWYDDFSGAAVDWDKWIVDEGDGCDVGLCDWGNGEKQVSEALVCEKVVCSLYFYCCFWRWCWCWWSWWRWRCWWRWCWWWC